MTLLYWEWHLIRRWPLRSIFTRFPEQPLKYLVSWGSPGECSMINRFLGDAFVFFPASFGVLFCSLVLGCRYTLKLLDCAVSGARFLTGGVLECDIAHSWSVAVMCMLYKIRCNPVHPLNGALPLPYVSVRVTRGSLVAHRYTYAPPRCRTSEYSRTFIPLLVSLWTILLTQYSMGWDWRVPRAGPMFFIGLSCSIPTIVFSFSVSLLSVYRLVLWGWSLRTDRD